MVCSGSPAWIAVDTVRVYVNGVERKVFPVAAGERPRFHTVLSQPITADSFIVVVASGQEALPGDVLAVGDGAILYRDVLTEQRGGRLEIASPAFAHPDAASLVELAAPRFLREEHDRLFDVAPLYLRKSDAEIAWDRRIGDA